ncbi:MAG: FHA domain-containing protein [Candidatus Latescibacteria bacterium]|nr:FHA domain-containing protein [bacterium]MBD3423431.1 FHA domain-containing protein [Candidatus Latescibacterota bacterium]
MTNRSKTLKRNKSRKGNGNRKQICIKITNGCFAGLEIPVERKKTTIGSDINCNICLDHNLVSGEHALITRSGDSCKIEDLNSKQGIFINGKEVHNARLKNRDRISIGNFDLLFYC